MDDAIAFRESLKNRIVIDIVLSDDPGAAIGKWRGIFKVSQSALADKMQIGSSIISDYESGRRKSPGVAMIKKIVNALVSIDEEAGSVVSREFSSVYTEGKLSDSIIDSRELAQPRNISDIAPLVKGIIIADESDLKKSIGGYTIIDSLKAIVEASPGEFAKLHGMTKDKAVVFTGVERGRSPLVAIKVANIKPGVVIFHGPKEIDRLAERIACVERIPIIISCLKTVDELVVALKNI